MAKILLQDFATVEYGQDVNIDDSFIFYALLMSEELKCIYWQSFRKTITFSEHLFSNQIDILQ